MLMRETELFFHLQHHQPLKMKKNYKFKVENAKKKIEGTPGNKSSAPPFIHRTWTRSARRLLVDSAVTADRKTTLFLSLALHHIGSVIIQIIDTFAPPLFPK